MYIITLNNKKGHSLPRENWSMLYTTYAGEKQGLHDDPISNITKLVTMQNNKSCGVFPFSPFQKDLSTFNINPVGQIFGGLDFLKHYIALHINGV